MLVEAVQYEHVYLHEENVCHIEFPYIMFTAKLDTFSKDGLHLSIVFFLPVNLGLSHQHRNVTAHSKPLR